MIVVTPRATAHVVGSSDQCGPTANRERRQRRSIDEADPRATVALQTFRKGSDATYLCTDYKARRGSSGEPQLDAGVRLYRDGTEVFRRAPERLDPLQEASGQPVVGGLLQFRHSTPPGSYLLELVVADRPRRRVCSSPTTIATFLAASGLI